MHTALPMAAVPRHGRGLDTGFLVPPTGISRHKRAVGLVLTILPRRPHLRTLTATLEWLDGDLKLVVSLERQIDNNEPFAHKKFSDNIDSVSSVS